jgi:hypothetical protein
MLLSDLSCPFLQCVTMWKIRYRIWSSNDLCKNLIIALVFEKNANFFAENCWKLQKIVIITSTPGTKYEVQMTCVGQLCSSLIREDFIKFAPVYLAKKWRFFKPRLTFAKIGS